MEAAYTHGGDIYGLQAPVLDFSVNLNPLGIPPEVLKAVVFRLSDPPAYPDPRCRALTQAAAALEGADRTWYLWGNGAADLIFRLAAALRPRRALLPVPTFTEYEAALRLYGCQVCHHRLLQEDGFALTERFLSEIRPGVELVVLCDPNNPTGLCCPPALLREILRRCRQSGALLLVDQCFLELAGMARNFLTDELPGGGLVLLRALTKNYALAAFRIGYCLCADHRLRNAMAASGQPWPVSVPAMAAGEFALQNFPDWPYQAQTLIRSERGRLKRALERVGATVWAGEANFLFFYLERGDIQAQLLSRGFLIRDCRDMASLEHGGYYRIAVRTPVENDRLIQTLKELEGAGRG